MKNYNFIRVFKSTFKAFAIEIIVLNFGFPAALSIKFMVSRIKEDNVAVQIWSNYEVERWHGYARTLYKNESPASIYCGAGGRNNKCQALCVVGRTASE